MGHIPEDGKWYVADLVEEFTIEGEPNNVVHIEIFLIRADSPEEAYKEAMSLGGGGVNRYRNTDNKLVTATFRGLRQLTAIKGELEHGTELMWEKKVGLSQSELARLVKPRDELSVFAPDETRWSDIGSTPSE
jgi:hypothetical protein